MGVEQVKAFVEAVIESEKLQEMMQSTDDWASVAKAAGFEITEDDVTKLRDMAKGNDNDEISDDALENVAGGSCGAKFESHLQYFQMKQNAMMEQERKNAGIEFPQVNEEKQR